ncbi:hypothetical protein HW555_004554 [Spodoptera exigua]|uniref:Major facilitator superfamily (MFS) profile domain-containing protein n=1 Tax=Spodoptera exigua TaxID=7107 RepID=A0A835GKY0_SPOEX|nr:hypothetical protein HW555_004554 [Spodoptera exigua]
MGRSKGYQDLDDSHIRPRSPGPPMPPPQEIEMASVSVVPDDTFTVTQAVNALGFGWFQVKLSLFTGLCWMADSMEMTILSILSPALHCEWNISKYQQALTTTIVFMGMMLSSTFWGNISDRYGRKTALSMCGVLLFYYGLLSSIAPNFLWLLFLRGLVGFAIGCVPQSVTLYAEFLPTKQRAKCVVLLDCFWALGACLEVALALVVMPTLGVHWLTCSVNYTATWLPESARYHVASGEPDKALATLEQIAQDNGRPMLLGRLVCDDSVGIGQRGRLKHLLIPHLRNTSLLLWFIWMACAFCYYGLVLMTTELFETGPSGLEEPCAADCRPLQTTDYMDLLWTTLADRTFLTCILFLARGIIAGLFQAAYVYTPEVYPTALRATAVGACSAVARLGAMVTPYVAQVLLKNSIVIATSVYSLVAVLAAVACLALPIETKGREMRDTVTVTN